MRRLLGVAAVLLVAAGGCGAPSANPSSNELAAAKPHFPVALGDARTYFEKHSLECIGLENPGPVVAEWTCRRDEVGNRRRLRVGIQADNQGITQLVGAAEGDKAHQSAAYLIATVAGFVVPADQRDALDRWGFRHAEDGATRVFGNVSVELQPDSDERWVIIVLPNATDQRLPD